MPFPLIERLVHGEGKHMAGLQAGTPGDEPSQREGKHRVACRQAHQVRPLAGRSSKQADQ